MLTLYHNGDEYPIQSTEYYIRELASGLDEVIFDISIYDPIYAIIAEEENIRERDSQYYLVKQIDAGADTARIICQLDLDAWRAAMYVSYDSGSLTVAEQIDAIKPTGWTIQDHSGSSIRRTIKGDLTPYEICVECTGVYNVYIRWDNKSKICHIYTKQMGAPVGAFATRELNLKEINYKGKSNNLVTRLYAYGKDGLSFASINSGKPYVDNNTYDSRIICAYWQDDRYTDAASLKADAIDKLATMAIPERSYECSIVDLQATNPELYNNLDFSLFKTAVLIDDVKNTAVNYQVVERHIYPYHPADNEVIFDKSPLKITATVISIAESIEDPNSDFQQIQRERIDAATDWLLSGDGYVVAIKDTNGTWKELLFMDTNDMSTAQDVLRINKNGIGFSRNGVNGPYTNAWTIDGNLVADFITTGTLTANLIKAGVLTDAQGKFSLNMNTGALTMNDGTFKGTISGGSININNKFKVDTSGNMEASSAKITGGQLNINNNFTVDTSGNMTAKAGYIGNGSYGFKIANTYIANKLTSVGDTSQDGAYYGINGMAVNAAGKHSHVMGSEIVTQGTISAKGFNVGDNGDVNANVINGRFKNLNGMYFVSVPDSHTIAFSHQNGGYLAWAGASDRRLKENVKPIPADMVRRFMADIEPVQFDYINDEENKTEYGVIAQDLEKIFEDMDVYKPAVLGELEGDEHYKYVNYEKMTGLLIAAIKDLYAEVEELKNNG